MITKVVVQDSRCGIACLDLVYHMLYCVYCPCLNPLLQLDVYIVYSLYAGCLNF